MIDQAGAPEPEAVALVGMAGRFPRARTLDEFWDRLAAGEELVTFFTDAELLASGIPAEVIASPGYVKARAVLEDAELFDAEFFGINPRDAEIIDPQQRIFLECAWDALEHAGYAADRFDGAIGVYAGLSMNSYLFNNLARNPEVLATVGAFQMVLAGDKDFMATRTSYKLNLRGPSVVVQSACSTSLVAVQLACQSLLNYECDMALAGGVSVSSPRASGYVYQPGMIMSPDGHCRAFDARGRGIVPGEGAGIVVLKRLSEALADGDTIQAVIRGAAINNDGSQKVGFTAPSVEGQAEVIAMAQAMAGAAPESISYIEAHGTATELGDPIEIAALTQAFRAGTDARGYCALGSVKTNLGHLDAAAGIAGLLKTVLALQHRQIPPSLHFESPNPNIDFASSPFYVNSALKEWTTSSGVPRRAGVSSFGIGGTNAHVVVEEAPITPLRGSAAPSQLLVLSARTPAALEHATDRLAQHLLHHPELEIADVAYTLQAGRKDFGERRIIVASHGTQPVAAALQRRDPTCVLGASTAMRDRSTVFLFPGQGSQYINMARELYTAEPVFAVELDRCAQVLLPRLDLDLRDVLYPAPGSETKAAEQLLQTRLAQPALFAVEYALARLWASWGVAPSSMLGHSIGEYVAACLAGVFSVEDALELVAARGQLVQALPGGSMLSVSLSEAEVAAELDDDLALAAVNGPRLCVVSGPTPRVHALELSLERRGVGCRALHTSHAFHSPMMEPAMEPFRRRVAQVSLHAPSIEYISNLTGTWITPQQATNPDYWADHLRGPVRFAAGAAELFARDPQLVHLEMGSGALTSLVLQHPERPQAHIALASLRHPQDPASDHAFLMTTVGRLWLAGTQLDWSAMHAAEPRRRVPLPTYPFERQRFWIEPKTDALVHSPSVARNDASPTVTVGSPHRRADVASWLYQPSWRRVDLPASGLTLDLFSAPHNWLVFCDDYGLGNRLADLLIQHGQHVVRVQQGETYRHPEPNVYELQVADAASYQALIRDLRAVDAAPDRVVYLWNLRAMEPEGADLISEQRTVSQDLAFYSLLYLAQALGDVRSPSGVNIDVIANGVCDVVGDEPLAPARATLLGPCRAIPQEYGGVTCRLLDLRLPEPGACDDLLANVWTELRARDAQPVVAYRAQRRWLPTFESLDASQPPSPSPAVRQHGVYLITGGLGGVGLALAEYLAREAQARLVLTSRTPFPERAQWDTWLQTQGESDAVSRRIRKLETLEELGSEVLTVAADVTSREQMQQVVARARARFGPINGVIHAAGVAGRGAISSRTRDEADQILAPKVLGAAVLDAALVDEPLDFLVLCSSTSSILGGAAIEYCAANAFLSALAHAHARQGKPTIAIDWGVWQEVGMAVDVEVAPNLEQAKQAVLRSGMLTREAQDAFGRVLLARLPEAVVSPQDLPQLVDLYARLSSPSQTFEQATDATASAADGRDATHLRPMLANAYVAPRTSIEEELAEIWQALLGIAAIGVHDSFFDLGGHSLLATQLLGRVERVFGVEIPLRSIFEAQTIAEQAERIDTLRWAAQAAALAGATLGERDEIEL